MDRSRDVLSDVTVVVSARERFSLARESLESIFRSTPGLMHLVYVDGGAPRGLRRYLESASASRGFTLIRKNRYLAPNEARNLGLEEATTRYVVFVDNDVFVETGWLEALVTCAEESGASVVGPLCTIDVGGHQRIHMAGGRLRIAEDGGGRFVLLEPFHEGEPIPPDGVLERDDHTDVSEFHTVLVRRDVFDKIGPLDEGLLSMDEHTDLCLSVRQIGGTIAFEPASRITYVTPMKLDPSDIPFFVLRWSERWNRKSVGRLVEKWSLEPKHPRNVWQLIYGRHHRLRALRLVRNHGGGPFYRWAFERVVARIEGTINGLWTSFLATRGVP